MVTNVNKCVYAHHIITNYFYFIVYLFINSVIDTNGSIILFIGELTSNQILSEGKSGDGNTQILFNHHRRNPKFIERFQTRLFRIGATN